MNQREIPQSAKNSEKMRIMFEQNLKKQIKKKEPSFKLSINEFLHNMSVVDDDKDLHDMEQLQENQLQEREVL